MKTFFFTSRPELNIIWQSRISPSTAEWLKAERPLCVLSAHDNLFQSKKIAVDSNGAGVKFKVLPSIVRALRSSAANITNSFSFGSFFFCIHKSQRRAFYLGQIIKRAQGEAEGGKRKNHFPVWMGKKSENFGGIFIWNRKLIIMLNVLIIRGRRHSRNSVVGENPRIATQAELNEAIKVSLINRAVLYALVPTFGKFARFIGNQRVIEISCVARGSLAFLTVSGIAGFEACKCLRLTWKIINFNPSSPGWAEASRFTALRVEFLRWINSINLERLNLYAGHN